jgi:predicted HicB family RNase H-like nuclease
MLKSKSTDQFDGYGIHVFQDHEGDWVAHLAEMPNVSAFGPTVEKALKELEIAWRLVKESYAEEGKPIPVAPARREYGGVFQVRIDKRVHRDLTIEAERSGLTLNALVAQKLAKSANPDC